jgi:hypothetical protein
MKTFKRLSKKHKEKIAIEVKMMIAAHRDCLWSRWDTCAHPQAVDPTVWQCVVNEGYYGEAFGVMRALVALGYGYFGPDHTDAVMDGRSVVSEHNLKWWFNQLLKEYLDEEGFFDKSGSAEKCHILLNKYRELVRK